MTNEVSDTLAQRGKHYGEFATHAIIAQSLKNVIRMGPGAKKASPDVMEALDMIMHKAARLMNGDPHHVDSWHDIQGYAKLVEDRLLDDIEKKKKEVAETISELNAGVPGDG